MSALRDQIIFTGADMLSAPPLSKINLASAVRDHELAEHAQTALRLSEPTERETSNADPQWFLRRVQPSRTEGGHFRGVVIIDVDITERKRINATLIAAAQEADRATRAN